MCFFLPLFRFILTVQFNIKTNFKNCLHDFRYCFTPFGISLGIKSTKIKRASSNEVLEKAYLQNCKMKHKEVLGLAKQLDWSERRVERWLRLRHAQDKPSTLTKFCENG